MQRLISLYNDGKLISAVRMAEKYIRRFPSAVLPYNIRGASLLDLGNIEAAVVAFQKVIELQPKSPEAHNNLGLAQQRAGENDDAIASYRKAVTLKPQFSDAHNNLGVLLSDLGQSEEAIDSYRTAIYYTPSFAEAFNNLGAALADLDETAAAVEAYQQAIQIKPFYAEAHNNLGIVLQRLKQWDDSIDSYRRALKIDPRYAAAHNNLGGVLQNIGRLDDALESYQHALNAQPEMIQTLNNLGNIYRQLDRFDDAILNFNRILAVDPNNAEAHNNLGIVYKKCFRFDEEKACYSRALELEPNFLDARVNLGGALLREEKYDEAIECYQTVDPKVESEEISALILECYYRNGNRTAYEIQLQLIKTRQSTYNFRAGAAAAFIAHQYGIDNLYSFCEKPIDKVCIFNVLKDGKIDKNFINSLCHSLYDTDTYERFSPGHISNGYKTVGNLFSKGNIKFEHLEEIIRTYITKYYKVYSGEGSLFIQGWPNEYFLDGWYIRLLQGGEISAHTHSAWISGILYLKLPNKNNSNEGNIEFTLCGYDLPVVKDNYPRKMVKTEPGTLVLFPSSLPHRVIPFTSHEERVCIPFDIIPK